MVRKVAGEYSKTKEEQLGQAVKAAFDWFSTCYGAITIQQIVVLDHIQKMEMHMVILNL